MVVPSGSECRSSLKEVVPPFTVDEEDVNEVEEKVEEWDDILWEVLGSG
jgi:hypothetical protein